MRTAELKVELMHKCRFGVIYLCCALLCGCFVKDTIKSELSAYAEPVDGPMAHIRLIGSRNVKVYPNSTCVSTDVPGSGYPAGPQMGGQRKRDLGMPKTAPMPKHFVEIAARADQPIAAGFSFYAESTMPGIPGTGMPNTSRSASCYAARSFVPKPGGQYEVVARWADGCAVDIMQLEQGPDGAWRRVGVLSSPAPGCAATAASSNSSVSSPK